MPQSNYAHAPRLSPQELRLVKAVLRNKSSRCNEKPGLHEEEQPLLAATEESPLAAMKTQRSQKQIHF